MDVSVFLELSLILAIAGGVATVMKIFKQPLVIGYILTGLLVGPYALNILASEETLGVFADFGIALLLFIIGLGLNPRVIKDIGKVAVIVGVGQFTFTALIGFSIARILGFDTTHAFYIAAALTLSSTIIILKILSDKKETTSLYGKIATGFLLVQDLIATVLLIVVASSSKGGTPTPELLITTGYGILAAALLTAASLYVLPKTAKFMADSQEYLFLFSIAWGIGFGALFSKIGLSLEVGALFAGVALASQTYAQEIGSRLRPLRDFFIVIFFVVLGAELGIDNLGNILAPAAIFSAFVLIGNPIIVMTIMGLMGYTKKTSFKAGLTVAQISEFSLVFILLASENGIIEQEAVSIVTFVGLITIAASTYMMMFDDKLYALFENHLQLFERRKVEYEQETVSKVDIFLFGYNHGGHELVKSFKKLKKKYMVIDYDPETIDHLKHSKIPYAYGDATDPEFLDEIGLENARLVISTMRNFNDNLFLVTHTQAVNPRAIIIAHSENPEEAAKLYEHGATYVMMPHYIGSERVSNMISRKGLKKTDFIPSREKHLRYVQTHLE